MGEVWGTRTEHARWLPHQSPGPGCRSQVKRSGASGGGQEAVRAEGEAGVRPGRAGLGSLPPAPGPVASPSGLCPRGRYVSERSRRVWGGGARGGARPRPRRSPHRRYFCHGPSAPTGGQLLQPGGGRPDSATQTQPPGPGARLHGGRHRPLPGPARLSRAFCSCLVVVPWVAAAPRWLEPLPEG